MNNNKTDEFFTWGLYMGLIMSTLWIIIAIYGIIAIKNIDNKLIIKGIRDFPYSKYYYIIPIFLLLLEISNICYYIINSNSPNFYVNLNVFIISAAPLAVTAIFLYLESFWGKTKVAKLKKV